MLKNLTSRPNIQCEILVFMFVYGSIGMGWFENMLFNVGLSAYI